MGYYCKKNDPNIKAEAGIRGELTRDISMCPAIMLAASRTERIKGRINPLTISIIKWHKGVGSFRWAGTK